MDNASPSGAGGGAEAGAGSMAAESIILAMTDPQTSAHPTILRIRRRKRDEHETLDALIVEDGRQSNRPIKRTRAADGGAVSGPSLGQFTFNAGKGIFRFAETVPASAFANDACKRSLKERITSLMQHPPPRQTASAPTRSTSKLASQPAGSRSSPASSSDLSSVRRSSSRHDLPASPASTRSSNSNLLLLQETAQRRARYRIIQEKRSMLYPADRPGSSSFSGMPKGPPVVRSTKPTSCISSTSRRISAASEDFRILDARLESASTSDDDEASRDPIAQSLRTFTQMKQMERANRDTTDRPRFGEDGLPAMVDSNPAGRHEDDLMANFVPMLQEYLSLNRPSTPQSPRLPDGSNDVSPPHPGFESVPDLSSGDAADSDSEWVYDVYYRDANNDDITAGAGGVDVAGNGGLQRIAALTGLEESEVLLGEGEGDEDSDINTEDEDSNEEDFYRNDYPEGDEDASDDTEASGSDESEDRYESD